MACLSQILRLKLTFGKTQCSICCMFRHQNAGQRNICCMFRHQNAGQCNVCFKTNHLCCVLDNKKHSKSSQTQQLQWGMLEGT